MMRQMLGLEAEVVRSYLEAEVVRRTDRPIEAPCWSLKKSAVVNQFQVEYISKLYGLLWNRPMVQHYNSDLCISNLLSLCYILDRLSFYFLLPADRDKRA